DESNTVYSRNVPTPIQATTMAAMKKAATPRRLPRKPKTIKPPTTPAPIDASSSMPMASTPVIGSRSKRTRQKTASAESTAQVKALLVTRSQKQLAMTGNTTAPQSAPTNTSMTRISSEKLARMMPSTVATIMVIRPINSIFFGSALFLAMFLPYTSAIMIADSADRSESAVEDRKSVV